MKSDPPITGFQQGRKGIPALIWDPENLSHDSEWDEQEDAQLFFTAVMNWHISIIRRLDEQTYEREAPKVGRNDPCPCGSGQKYKRCCMN